MAGVEAPPDNDSSLHTCFTNAAALGTTMTYIGIMEDNMETTIMGYIGIIGYILGLYWDNGKENGNYLTLPCHPCKVLLHSTP